MTVRVEPTREPMPATELDSEVAGSFLRMLRPPELVVRPDPDPEDLPPVDGLLTVAPVVLPFVPVAGASGLRMARGPDVPPTVEPTPRRVSRERPVVPLLRSMTRPPFRGSTEIFVPAGLRLSVGLLRLILFRLLRASPRNALAAMCGSLRCSRRTTVSAREPAG